MKLRITEHARRALKRYEEATQHYIARIKLWDAWVEERYMAAIQIATFAKEAYDRGDLVSRQVCVCVM
jgi:hypothetical protein